jgi:hypothetical protein
MHRFHVTTVALLVAGAAVLGAVAVTRTTGLGSAARHANDAAVASQTRQLAAYAAKLRQELKAKPPALPKVPTQAPAAAAPTATPQIVYHRPPPIVHVIHHHGDDGSSEPNGGGGGDG